MRLFLRTWQLSLLIATVACGMGLQSCSHDGMPKLYQVKGKILLDGNPAPDATVVFEPIRTSKSDFARPGNAYTDKDGNFTAWTLREGDGLPAGRFRVAIISQVQVGGPVLNEMSTTADYNRVVWEWKVPQKYADPATSGIEVEVTRSGMKPEVIELSSK